MPIAHITVSGSHVSVLPRVFGRLLAGIREPEFLIKGRHRRPRSPASTIYALDALLD